MGIKKDIFDIIKSKSIEISPKTAHSAIKLIKGTKPRLTKAGKPFKKGPKTVPLTESRRKPGQRRISDIKKLFKFTDEEMTSPSGNIGQDLKNRFAKDAEMQRKGLGLRSRIPDRRMGSEHSAIGAAETKERLLISAIRKRQILRESKEAALIKQRRLDSPSNRQLDLTKGPGLESAKKQTIDGRKTKTNKRNAGKLRERE